VKKWIERELEKQSDYLIFVIVSEKRFTNFVKQLQFMKRNQRLDYQFVVDISEPMLFGVEFLIS
jgi:hypothetical protein